MLMTSSRHVLHGVMGRPTADCPRPSVRIQSHLVRIGFGASAASDNVLEFCSNF